MNLEFIEDDYQIRCGGTELTLLPKEFALLRFLVQNPNRVWSRDELLGRVWPNEDPVDRTVDDHVYRLRKRLKRIAIHGSTIETVRGRGYRYVNKNAGIPSESDGKPQNPILDDPGYQHQVRSLFEQFVLYGYGEGLKTLRETPAVFGLHQDRMMLLQSKFMSGDFRGFIDDDALSFTDKSMFFLSLFSAIHPDSAVSLRCWNAALEQSLISKHYLLEVECFELPTLYMRLGMLEKARDAISKAVQYADALDLEGFRPLVRLYDVMISLYSNELDEAETKLELARDLLKTHAWKRELGYFEIIRGLWALRNGRGTVAEPLLDKGFSMLHDSGFVNHVILRLRDVIEFMAYFGVDDQLYRKYKKVWAELAVQYDFSVLQADLQNIFATCL